MTLEERAAMLHTALCACERGPDRLWILWASTLTDAEAEGAIAKDKLRRRA